MNPTRKTTHRIQTAGQSAIDIADRMFVAITNAHAAATDPKSLSDRPVAEDAGIRGKGGHSDPTADQAIAGIGIHERVFELMLANIATLELAVSNLTQFCEQWAPERLDDHPRCNAGRDSVQPWARPDCPNFAAYTKRPDGSLSMRSDGLCDACRMRKSRHAKGVEDAA
jgi:hypothetical protein